MDNVFKLRSSDLRLTELIEKIANESDGLVVNDGNEDVDDTE